MIPKLFVRLREAIFLQTTSDGKERASGYNHTYHDNRDINLNALSIFPSDSEIQDAIESAYEESENLWHFLGFNVDWDSADVETVRLPTIESWFTPGQKSSTLCNLIDSDYESDLEPEEVRVSETRQIHDAITHLETAKQKLSLDEEDKVSNLTFAAVSLAVNDSMEIRNLMEYDADTKTKTLEMEASMVKDAIRRCLPSLILPEEPLAPLDRPVTQSLNFNTLVELRFSHQRKQAKTGVRKWCTLTAASSSSSNSECQEEAKSEVSLTRREILNEMNAVIKGLEEKGVSTTVGRTLRWQPGRNPKPADAATTGNSVNAQEMARKQSSALLKKRRDAFGKHSFPEEYGTARVTANTPLTSSRNASNGNGFGFVMVKEHIALAKVLSIYSKSGGKNGKHGRVEGVSCITASSYIPVQIFEHHRGLVFDGIARSRPYRGLARFALLPPSAFLINLDRAPKGASTATLSLEIAETDFSRFSWLLGKVQ